MLASAVLSCGVESCSFRSSGIQEPGSPGGPPTPRAKTPPVVPTRPGETPFALGVLHRWDAARSEAYDAGSAAALRALYVPGCSAARRDVRLLRSYAARGLRVRGLAVQVLSWRTVERDPGRLTLRVVDRVASAVVTDTRGRARSLPRDQPRVHLVGLVRGADGRWRVSRTAEAEDARVSASPR